MTKQEFEKNYPEALLYDNLGGDGWCMEDGSIPPMRAIDKMYIAPFLDHGCFICTFSNEQFEQFAIVLNGHVAFINGDIDNWYTKSIESFLKSMYIYNETHSDRVDLPRLLNLYDEYLNVLNDNEFSEFYSKYTTEQDHQEFEDYNEDWVTLVDIVEWFDYWVGIMRTGMEQGFDVHEELDLRETLEEKHDRDLSQHSDAMFYVAMAIEVMQVYDNVELPDFFEDWNKFIEFCEEEA